MKVLRVATVLIGSGTSSFMANAQDGFFYKWENRVRSTWAEQPPWPVPLFAPSSNLTQLFRYDVVRQITHVRTDTWNYDFSKGFFRIPWYSTEVDRSRPTSSTNEVRVTVSVISARC